MSLTVTFSDKEIEYFSNINIDKGQAIVHLLLKLGEALSQQADNNKKDRDSVDCPECDIKKQDHCCHHEIRFRGFGVIR